MSEHFDKTTFQKVHANTLDIFSRVPLNILDIGSGTGRDAFALSQMGHAVTAVDLNTEFLNISRERYGEGIAWLHDSLPKLEHLADQKFNCILLSGVWMFLSHDDRKPAFDRITELADDKAVIILKHRTMMPSDDPKIFHEIEIEELEQMSREAGLEIIRTHNEADTLERDTTWQTNVFMKV